MSPNSVDSKSQRFEKLQSASEIANKMAFNLRKPESVSTGVWWVLGFGAVLKSLSNPRNCRKKEKILEKNGTLIFRAKLWYAPNPGSKEILWEKRIEIATGIAMIKLPQRRSAKGVRSLFFVFGTLSVTFWSLFLMLLSLFCRHFFAKLLLPDSFCGTPEMIRIAAISSSR